MSESISAGPSTATSTSQSTSAPAQAATASQQSVSQSSAISPAQTSQAQGEANTGQATESPQERFLANEDLDAYIEQTINGKKEKIKIRDALRGYGLEKTATQRMQEAAAERKRTQQLMHLMQTDFEKYCEITGQDINQFLKTNLAKRKEIAEEILAREYDLQQMDPNQRRAMELEQELNSVKQRELSSKQPIIDKIKELVPAENLLKGLEDATIDQLNGYLHARQEEFNTGLNNLQNELLDAWQKVGLPREKDFGSWMAQVMRDHERRTVEHKKRTGEDLPPLHPEQAAARVKERFLRSSQALYDQMDGANIVAAIGEKAAEKVREHFVNLASNQNSPKFNNQNERPVGMTASEPKKHLNQLEWRKHMGLA